MAVMWFAWLLVVITWCDGACHATKSKPLSGTWTLWTAQQHAAPSPILYCCLRYLRSDRWQGDTHAHHAYYASTQAKQLMEGILVIIIRQGGDVKSY